MLYGEKFQIIYKKGDWLKIKTSYDNYIGYIQNKSYLKKFKPSFKISSLKSNIFIKKNKKLEKTNKFLFFASRIAKKMKIKIF